MRHVVEMGTNHAQLRFEEVFFIQKVNNADGSAVETIEAEGLFFVSNINILLFSGVFDVS